MKELRNVFVWIHPTRKPIIKTYRANAIHGKLTTNGKLRAQGYTLAYKCIVPEHLR